MSYNVRTMAADDGVNCWPNRKDAVADLIKRYNPAVVGLQVSLYAHTTCMHATLIAGVLHVQLVTLGS